MATLVIYYIRHGETSWNAEGRLQGTQDTELNDLGRRQAVQSGHILADLLARSGIDLIAERIESEAMVVDLLDYDVRFGQGFLFSPPRPVRAEALQGSGAQAGRADGDLTAARAVNA